MPAFDYTLVADIYDDYCLYSNDVRFFESLAGERHGGRTLELMAGTGRLSLPLARSGARLVSVDQSIAMLSVLRRKARSEELPVRIVCADARRLPFRRTFDLALLPFNGISELTDEEARSEAIDSIAGVLAEDGWFVCTLYNRAARLRSVDGEWHDYPDIEQSSGGCVRLSFRGVWDSQARLVRGEQRIVLAAEGVDRRELKFEVSFALPTVGEIIRLAERAALRLISLTGGYEGETYDEEQSTQIVATFENDAKC